MGGALQTIMSMLSLTQTMGIEGNKYVAYGICGKEDKTGRHTSMVYVYAGRKEEQLIKIRHTSKFVIQLLLFLPGNIR